MTVGAVVSMTMDLVPPIDPAEPGAGSVRTAALGLVVTVSKMVPPLSAERRCWCSRAWGYSGRRPRCK